MKNIRTTLICLVCSLLLAMNAHAKNYKIVEEVNYAKNLIGSSYSFSEKVVYVDLSAKNNDSVNRNGGIKLALTRARIAEFNKKLITKPVSAQMRFRLIKVLKTIHTNLENWDKGAKEAYMNFAKISPDVDMLYVFKDSNGVISTAMPGTFKQAAIINANKAFKRDAKQHAPLN